MGADRKEPMERALVALNYKERTVAELSDWLLERDYSADEVEATVSELIELGGLDDERYSRLFAEDKRELEGWGPERIEAALRERGVDARLIAEACAVDDRDAQLERALGLLAGRNLELEDDSDRNRALGFLARRGYAYEIAYDAVRAAGRQAG